MLGEAAGQDEVFYSIDLYSLTEYFMSTVATPSSKGSVSVNDVLLGIYTKQYDHTARANGY